MYLLLEQCGVVGVCTDLLLMDQRNSVRVIYSGRGGVGNVGGRRGLIEGEGCREGRVIGGDGHVVSEAELFKGSYEAHRVLIELLFLEEEYFGYCDGEILRAVPVENLYGGATVEEMISDDDLRAEEVEEGIDAEVNYYNGELVKRVTPLEIVIVTGEERGMGEPLIDGREGPVVGPVDKTIARVIDL